jgi:hypothetical protein
MIRKVMDLHSPWEPKSVDDIVSADRWARIAAIKLLKK